MQDLPPQTVLVAAPALQALGREVLVAHGVDEADASQVAGHLVEANLRGTDSHGMARLPHYVGRLRAGSIASCPRMRFERLAPSLGLLDGDHGLGHLVMRRATEAAGRLAAETGAGWVAVRNSSHCGALAPFGLHLAAQGMLGFVFTHVDPMVLPHAAREPFCGTNPICIAAPGEADRALCLDMATSIVPWNLIANAASEGVPIREGWGVDSEGRDTSDPRRVHALFPFGGYKGSGLGIMIDVLCALLGNTPYGPDIPKMYGDLAEHRLLGGLVGAIAITPFVPREHFAARVAELMSRLGALPRLDPAERVRFPGEPELETKRVRTRDGIPIGMRTLAELNELAAAAGAAQLPAP